MMDGVDNDNMQAMESKEQSVDAGDGVSGLGGSGSTKTFITGIDVRNNNALPHHYDNDDHQAGASVAVDDTSPQNL
jgi:hypothetical protein